MGFGGGGGGLELENPEGRGGLKQAWKSGWKGGGESAFHRV